MNTLFVPFHSLCHFLFPLPKFPRMSFKINYLHLTFIWSSLGGTQSYFLNSLALSYVCISNRIECDTSTDFFHQSVIPGFKSWCCHRVTCEPGHVFQKGGPGLAPHEADVDNGTQLAVELNFVFPNSHIFIQALLLAGVFFPTIVACGNFAYASNFSSAIRLSLMNECIKEWVRPFAPRFL